MDLITDGLGSSTIEGGADDDEVWAGGGPDLVVGDGTGAGATGDEVISGDDTLYGEGGHDAMAGGLGDDVMDAGPGDDELETGGAGYHQSSFGNDTMIGGPGDDLLEDGGNGREVIQGGEGNDRVLIFPSIGDDTEDQIDAGLGDGDIFDFQNYGPLTIDLSAGTAEGRGREAISGFEIVWTSFADADDRITGNDEDNTILSRGGDDVIRGLGGDDVIDAGAGSDDVDGGEGSDSCAGAEKTFGCES